MKIFLTLWAYILIVHHGMENVSHKEKNWEKIIFTGAGPLNALLRERLGVSSFICLSPGSVYWSLSLLPLYCTLYLPRPNLHSVTKVIQIYNLWQRKDNFQRYRAWNFNWFEISALIFLLACKFNHFCAFPVSVQSAPHPFSGTPAAEEQPYTRLMAALLKWRHRLNSILWRESSKFSL